MELGPIFRALRRHHTRFVLIAVEVAFTLAIVVNCLSLIGRAKAAMNRPSGFDDENLIWVESETFAPAFADEAYARQVIDADREVLRHLPGVRAAANTFFLPWQGGGSSFEVKIQGSDRQQVRSQAYRADPDLPATLDMEVVAGRNFTWEEYAKRTGDETSLDILVSQALADLLFPEGGALGKVLTDTDERETYTIVGILDEFYNPYGWPIHEYVCFFVGPSGGSGGSGYLVRTEAGQVPAVRREIERALLASTGGRTLTVETIVEVKDRYNLGNRVTVASLNAIMVLLVLVTILGIVGITSFSVAERTRQIGTRRALGATREDILRHFMLEIWLLTTVGIVLGVALAIGLNVGLVNIMDDARLDGAILAGAVVALWLVGLGSALGPALRAARIPPAVATRNV
jgi:putative ABC transport system permease protein